MTTRENATPETRNTNANMNTNWTSTNWTSTNWMNTSWTNTNTRQMSATETIIHTTRLSTRTQGIAHGSIIATLVTTYRVDQMILKTVSECFKTIWTIKILIQIVESDNSSAGYINQRRNNALHVDSPYDVADPALMQPEQNGSRHSGLDQYGRLIPDRIPQKDTRLDAILPDSPFGVIRRKLGRKKKPSESLQFMPILQFCTWRSELYVMARNPGRVSATKTLGAGLRWSDIVDSQGDWCGSIVLDEKCVSKRQGHMCTFIALSEAKRFNMDECPVWTYYIPKEREESEWDLYYVLLLERNEEHGLWERVGLGKVFQAAFRENIWAEIKLG
ncbi:hypothetical protein N7490_009298 [Penicillium lividum]|nr:hypothetical protein N7490_009298 [Penicillium lividum]